MNNKTILLVGNNLKNEAESLKLEGHQVIHMSKPYYELESTNKQVDLVMVELDRQGLQVCKKLHRSPNTLHVPIVAVLGSNSSQQDCSQAFKYGCIDLISHKKTFMEKVRKYLNLSNIYLTCKLISEKL